MRINSWEVQRRQLNDALRSGYANLGADGVLDLEGMVVDSSEPNRIAPSLLTNGAPNSSFHSTVAQAVAVAVTGFPPLEL